MNASERLNAMSDTLKQRGVVDVKFYFERGSLSSMPSSEVTSRVADFVECYAAGKGTQQVVVGDEA